MGVLVNGTSALVLASVLTLLGGTWSALGQDLRETDALCGEDGCFAVYFQRKTFLDSWRACKKRGGNLATIKNKGDAAAIASLFSSVDLRHSRTKVQVWIGLQRQPRQCTSARPLRGFSWTTGDQDTEFTNWLREDSPSTCSVSRCVVMSYNTQDHTDNLKWLDGACSVSVDGYLCHYTFRGMCTALWSEGAGNAHYTTPFSFFSTLLTHVPFGSLAALPCPEGSDGEQSVLCTEKEDGSVGWSREPPLCSTSAEPQNWCEQDNGGCEHYCKPAGGHFYCECADGYQLGDDGQSCEQADVCQDAPCMSECLSLPDGYRCACPEGYMLASDERSCLDVDECLQSPCEQICVNAPGTFECQCREGFRPDKAGGCEDVDECVGVNPCEHVCENTAGSYLCHCRLGYSPPPEDPSRCQEDDECQIPGICEQMCVNYEGGFECFCEEGFELMADHSSCRKIGEEDDQSTATPAFPWGTHQPMWDPEYDWTPQQSHTNWPPEEEPALDWQTDPPSVQDSDVIWVTSSPQEEPFDSEEKEEGEVHADSGGAYLLELGQRSESDLDATPTTIHPTPSSTIRSTLTPDWYDEDEEEEEEEMTMVPTLHTSTTSGGAWNWWEGLTTFSQKPGNPDDLVTDLNTPTDSSNRSEEDQPTLGENPELPAEERRREDEEITRSQDPTVPSQPSTSAGGGNRNKEDLEGKEEERGPMQSSTWLLVGLLVPLCIFVVVMVALGIVYCTRCAVQPRNKNTTDCYHWISGAHDKQGAAHPSAGVKSHV
ncbi:CD248 molecule%2C endosialin a [Xyrichtys novacula]|uniref:CD248 molecule, endosialin a n=1 Tax=Xyrichtys novacula TaxID=13765 RepID=A0AAV1HKT4_XYRNO|nr:CD248 molecule%2C endosialin a [Xyrichtys novacula]